MEKEKIYQCPPTNKTRNIWLKETGLNEKKLFRDRIGEYFDREILIDGDPVPQKIYLPLNIQIA